MLGGLAAEDGAVDGVDGGFQFGDPAGGDFREVGALGVPAADEAIGVLDSYFFRPAILAATVCTTGRGKN